MKNNILNLLNQENLEILKLFDEKIKDMNVINYFEVFARNIYNDAYLQGQRDANKNRLFEGLKH